jgi:DNA-binding winged helix-turn-helix (wHTH) protein/tetratricopeptide (TPR) repeat protein
MALNISPPDLASSPFQLGPWRVEPSLDALRQDGRSVKLEPRTMRLLCVLAQAQGELVRTAELLERVWPKLVVTSGSLYEAIVQLRKVLGTDAIATVPRKGYRLTMLAQRQSPNDEAAGGAPAALGPRSLAVLPFRLRGLPDSHAFVRESLLDDLIAELSRGSALAVVARGTMLSYVGEAGISPREVGRDLGAAFVVDGLLELRDEHLRVRVEVVDTAAGTQTWVDTVELPLAAWWETGGLVADRLARALNLNLLELAARSSTAVDMAVEPKAMMLATRAWVELVARSEKRDVTERAWAWAAEARALSPRLALASVCLAFCHWRAAQFGWGDAAPVGLRAKALQHAEEAIELAPREPDAHYVLGLVAYSVGQTLRAEQSLRHCLELSASHAPAYGLLALIRTRRGHAEEAAELCARAFALSPREPLRVVWHLAQAWAGLALGDFEAALQASRNAMAVNPDFATSYLTGLAAAQQLGSTDEARAFLAFLREHTVFRSLSAVRERLPPAREPAHRQQMDALLTWLAAAGLPPA